METSESGTTSIIDSSLRFFEEFFLKGGFHNLHENFFITQYKDSEGNWQSIGTNNVSREEEWRELVDRRIVQLSSSPNDIREDDNFYKEYFPDLLMKQLNSGVKESKKHIRENIASFDFDQEKIVTFLKIIINDLQYVISEVKQKDELSKYRQNVETLYRFVVYLFKRYNAFLLQTEFSIFNEATEFLQRIKIEQAISKKEVVVSGLLSKDPQPKNSKDIKGFKWKINPEENTYELYKFLTDKEIKLIPLDKETADNFKAAFSGRIIKEPLKIKWFHQSKRGDIKPGILRVINHLMFDLKLLEKINIQSQLADTIEAIFYDPYRDKPIEHVAVSISQNKKTKGVIKDMMLENFIKELCKVQFSAITSENK